MDEAQASFEWEDETGQAAQPLPEYAEALKALREILVPLLKAQPKTGRHKELVTEQDKEFALLTQDIERFHKSALKAARQWEAAPDTNAALLKLTRQFEPMAEASRDLIKQTDLIYKLATRLIDEIENVARMERERNPGKGSDKTQRNPSFTTRSRKAADESRQFAVEQLKQVRYFWRQAHWLTERFPKAKLRDVEGQSVGPCFRP